MGLFRYIVDYLRRLFHGGSNPPVPPPPPAPGVNQALLLLVNNARVVNGRPPLKPNAALDAAAVRHSADMARRGALFHVGSDGTRPQDRILAAGYVASATGECVAMNYLVWATVQAWMDHPPHRAVLLGGYEDVGFGVVGDYYTADLAVGHP